MFTKEYYQEILDGFHRQIRLLDERIIALSAKKGTAPSSSLAGSVVPDQPALDAVSAKMRTLLMKKKNGILLTIGKLPTDEAEALTFLYSAMPLSDLLDYPVSLFQAYAKHGAWLYRHGSFAGKVPERLFANYVLHHRINNEDIVDNRSFFYEQLQKTLGLPVYTASSSADTPLRKSPATNCADNCESTSEAGGTDNCESTSETGGAAYRSMYDAAVETNYWCAAQATYRASDGRTENPLTMYNSGTGRCGEESTFGVSALRSIGIPARQVYAPLWSHCDDNHAWVEVWCDNEWYFLGACEPEERLNFGWFTGPASRAMLLHSRWFGQDEPLDPIVSKKGMARVLNHLSRYAYTTELTVKIEDENGNPVPGAKVQFHVLNHGNYGLVAEMETGSNAAETVQNSDLITDYTLMDLLTGDLTADDTAETSAADCGLVHLTTGYGDLYATASKNGAFGDCHISLGNAQRKNAGKGAKMAAPAETFLVTDAASMEDASHSGDAAEAAEAVYTITLHEAPSCSDTWENVDFHAPSLGFLHDEALTDEQKATSAARLAEATATREARLDATWQEDRVADALAHFSESDAKELTEILHKAKGNLPELLKFLEWDAGALVPADWEAGRKDHWKLLLLQSLREKDYKDTTAEILIDCCENALPYAGTIAAPLKGTLPAGGFHFGPGPRLTSGNADGTAPVAPSDEIFFRLLANPRVENEMLRPCRHMLMDFFREEADALKKEPQKLPSFIKSLITSMPDEEYERLVTSPAGCLLGGIASELSIDVLCVTLYRCLGIPASLNMMDNSLQYYQGGKFITVSDTEKSTSCGVDRAAKTTETPETADSTAKTTETPDTTDSTAKASETPDTAAGSEKAADLAGGSQADAAPETAILRLVGDASLNLSNWEHYSVSKYQNGEFVRLFLFGSPIDVEKNEQTIEVKPGIYRVLTTNRMLNGNQLAKQIVFSLEAGEERTVTLSLRTPSLAENLVNRPVEELYFDTIDSSAVSNTISGDAQDAPEMAGVSSDRRVSLTQLIEGNDKALFLWLEVGREPTEHVLNELYDRKDAYAALESPLYVVLNKPEDLSDPTLQRTMKALPSLTPILGLSKDDLRTLAREVSQEADSLPLTVVMKKGNTCIYSNCGYNVGITDLLLQILHG
ncbi:MAG: hypothetical protein LUF30_11245 [Lachnospiraceae bacterium]|nr:hypothetical protein [Lachnospiraceae bacterium]